MSFLLELERSITTIDIIVYDKNENFLPNKHHLHGSANFELSTIIRNDLTGSRNGLMADWAEYSLFSQEIEITRSKWKSLNKESQRCSLGGRTTNAEKCIIG